MRQCGPNQTGDEVQIEIQTPTNKLKCNYAQMIKCIDVTQKWRKGEILNREKYKNKRYTLALRFKN